jgi:hypothetical protein
VDVPGKWDDAAGLIPRITEQFRTVLTAMSCRTAQEPEYGILLVYEEKFDS